MAQSLWHHNFATVHHRGMRFSAKRSERNAPNMQSHVPIGLLQLQKVNVSFQFVDLQF